MTPEAIAATLHTFFDPTPVQAVDTGLWQIETDRFRVLVMLSDDHTWLRVLLPLLPAREAAPFWEQILESNFDTTQEVRYALHQGVLWGVFHHARESLTAPDLTSVLERLIFLHEQGLSACFNQLVEQRIRQIIQSAKLQGQSLEMTLQTLNRFYQEGLMGDLEQGAGDRTFVLAAWQRQLERLWPEVEPPANLPD